VIVIIGVVIAGAVLSLGSAGRDSQLEQERDRLVALIEYVRERAALQTVEYGLHCEQGGFLFVMYDTRTAQWLEDPLDEALRPRRLPPGLEIALRVEDRPLVLRTRADAAKRSAPPDLTPQIMLFSSGELTAFKLTLARSGTGRSASVSGTPAGKVEVGAIVEQAT
jgi:general secretion pathway protein H